MCSGFVSYGLHQDGFQKGEHGTSACIRCAPIRPVTIIILQQQL